jgi:iron(III) transport system ATP-binding protein
VLLDEPFSALDAALRTELRQDVRAALRADSATAVLVTHDQGEALSIADSVAVMRAGRIVQSGPPAEVYRAPADLWVARFVGEAVVLPATIHNGRVSTPLGDLPVAQRVDGATTILVRPEQIDLMPPGSPDAVPATVLRQHYHGHDALVHLRLDDGTELTARVLALDPVPARVAVRVRGPVTVVSS